MFTLCEFFYLSSTVVSDTGRKFCELCCGALYPSSSDASHTPPKCRVGRESSTKMLRLWYSAFSFSLSIRSPFTIGVTSACSARLLKFR